MTLNEQYLAAINGALQIANENLAGEDLLLKIKDSYKSLSEKLENDAYVKIPFVGDFSAGKSSLLNAFMGKFELLPTDITPETAVSYELWYSGTESLELWRNGSLVGTYPISDISKLNVTPGDVVKVFLCNDKIREYVNKGIILVDMPGIDSGIEAHTSAILNYIHQGTYFVIAVDIEQGTLRGTTLSFIEELKKYGMSASIFLTKCDKKPADEVLKIKESVAIIAKRYLGDNVFVGATSAHEGNFSDLTACLSNLDAETMIHQKYDGVVQKFIKSIADDLELKKKILSIGSKDYSKEIELVNDKKEKALNELRRNSLNAQSVEGSTADIIGDLSYALKASSSKLAAMLYGSKGNPESIDTNAELMSIIRPVLIKSFSRELSEYQDILDDGVQNFSVDLDDIFLELDDESERFEKASDIFGDILTTVFEAFEVPPVVANLIANKIAKFVPDVLRTVFGKSDAQVLSEIKIKIENELYPQLLNSIEPKVLDVLTKERKTIIEKAEAEITLEAEKFDVTISEILKEKELDSEERSKQIEDVDAALSKLVRLLQ